MIKRIENKHIKIVGGVLAGVSYKIQAPLWTIRVGFILLMFITGVIPLALFYILAWLMLPTLEISEEQFHIHTRPVKNTAFRVDAETNIVDTEIQKDISYKDLISEVSSEKNKELNK